MFIGTPRHLPHSLGRYAPGQVANARIRTGTAQLSGPHTGRGCFGDLSPCVEGPLAPLMSPWCTDGDVPTAVNLNLYGDSRAHVKWHCDDEASVWGCWGTEAQLFL